MQILLFSVFPAHVYEKLQSAIVDVSQNVMIFPKLVRTEYFSCLVETHCVISESPIFVLIVSSIFFLVVPISQCAKRIDVKKRMSEGLAKRGVQRRTPSQETKKNNTSRGSDVLDTLLKYRKGTDTNQERIQDFPSVGGGGGEDGSDRM